MVPSDKPPAPPPSESEEEERQLFLEAVEHLQAVPDKDRKAPRDAAAPKVRRLRPSKSKRARPQGRLDLHGKTVPEALRNLGAYLAEAQEDGQRVVLVITGKGQSSPDGGGILKGKVEEWFLRRGARYLSAYSEAPRHLGGKGAYVCYLRRPPGTPDVAY